MKKILLLTLVPIIGAVSWYFVITKNDQTSEGATYYHPEDYLQYQDDLVTFFYPDTGNEVWLDSQMYPNKTLQEVINPQSSVPPKDGEGTYYKIEGLDTFESDSGLSVYVAGQYFMAADLYGAALVETLDGVVKVSVATNDEDDLRNILSEIGKSLEIK